jgi:RNA polymerase sigma-70 factor (ECF subfamily)
MTGLAASGPAIISEMPDSSPPARFPSTMWSDVLACRSEDPQRRRERMGRLIERYWRPVYWALRADGGVKPEEARDLTQEFFVRIVEGQVISSVDPARGSFRHYLKGSLRHFLMNERRNATTQKRGGGARHLSLDFDAVGPEPAALQRDPEKALDQAWALQLLDEAVQEMERRLTAAGKPVDAKIFRSYEMGGSNRPSYADLAREHAMDERAVRTALRAGRRELRRILLEKISDYVRNEAELGDELRELFGF